MNRLTAMTRSGGERGFALFACLVILLVLTLLGTTGMQTTILQDRMAGHVRDRDLAFQAAEAALRDAEEFLTQATLPTFNGSNGLYQPADPGDPEVWESIDWAAASRTYSGTIDGVAAPPRYIIEELPAVLSETGSIAADEPATEGGVYRITARAVGGSAGTVVMLQSVYRR